MKSNHLISPIVVGLLGFLVFTIIYAFAPISPKVNLQLETVVYVLISYVMFFLGCIFYYVIPTKRRRINSFRVNHEDLGEQYRLSIFLAVLGISFRLIDRFYLRNVSLFQSAFENRELLEQADSGLLSIFGGLIYPICFLVLFLFLRKDGKLFSCAGLVILMLFFFPTFDALLFGSRSLILVNVMMFLLILRGTGRLKVKFTQVVYISILLVLLIGMSGYIFLARLDEMGLDVFDTIYMSGYAKTVGPSDWVANKLSVGLTFSNTLLFSWLNFTQYYTHGLFEFNNFLEMAVDSHSYGVTQFNVVYKLGTKILPLPSMEVVLYGVNPRPGVFTSFFGPAHMDFGYFSPFFIFIFGAVSAKLHKYITSNNSYYSVLYYMFVIIIFFMPVVSFIQSAQGLYIIFSIIFYGVVYRAFRKFPKIRIIK